MTPAEIAVGTLLPPLVIEPINRRTLALFAGGSGDHQPVHIDIDAAKARGRTDVFAPGMLSMAYVARMLTEWLPQSRLRSFRTRFTAETPLYGQPTCTGRVIAIDGGMATVEVVATLGDGTVTVRGEAVVDLR